MPAFTWLDNLCCAIILVACGLFFWLGWTWPLYIGWVATLPLCIKAFRRFFVLVRIAIHG